MGTSHLLEICRNKKNKSGFPYAVNLCCFHCLTHSNLHLPRPSHSSLCISARPLLPVTSDRLFFFTCNRLWIVPRGWCYLRHMPMQKWNALFFELGTIHLRHISLETIITNRWKLWRRIKENKNKINNLIAIYSLDFPQRRNDISNAISDNSTLCNSCLKRCYLIKVSNSIWKNLKSEEKGFDCETFHHFRIW